MALASCMHNHGQFTHSWLRKRSEISLTQFIRHHDGRGVLATSLDASRAWRGVEGLAGQDSAGRAGAGVRALGCPARWPGRAKDSVRDDATRAGLSRHAACRPANSVCSDKDTVAQVVSYERLTYCTRRSNCKRFLALFRMIELISKRKRNAMVPRGRKGTEAGRMRKLQCASFHAPEISVLRQRGLGLRVFFRKRAPVFDEYVARTCPAEKPVKLKFLARESS